MLYSDKHMTPAQQAAQDTRAEDDLREGSFQATMHTNLPLNDFMTRLMAEEIPLLDSLSRGRVYQLLREYAGPQITTQDELPAEIKQLLDL